MKTVNKRESVYLSIFLAFLFSFLIFSGCSKRKEPEKKEIKTVKESPSPSPSPSPKKKSGKPIEFKGTTLRSRDGKKNDWYMEASEVTYHQDKEQAEASVVLVKFFNPENAEVLTVSAKGAEVNLKDKSLKFRGEVEALSAKGEKLVAKKLRWDNEKKLLIGSGFVKITRKNGIMTAKNMKADPELKKVTLFGDVKVDYPEAGKFLKF